MIVSTLADYWRVQEVKQGRIITIQEVACATKLNWDTINNLKRNKTNRFDGRVVARLCRYFEIPDGSPIPFLLYCEESTDGLGI